MADDIFSLDDDTNLLGEKIKAVPTLSRELFAAGLHETVKDMSLPDFVRCLTNEVEAMTEYAALCEGSEKHLERLCLLTSLLFNPHRMDTPSITSPVSVYASLKDLSFADGLARAMIHKKGKVKDLLYQAIQLGINSVYYVGEFPPNVARELALKHGLTKTSRVLDPCAGWGGRMIGFSTRVDSYTCCEPSSRTASGLRQLSAFLRRFRSDFHATIYEAPFEDVELPAAGFDFAMTSPPYYDTEHYAIGERNNSFNRYDTFDKWCDGFYYPLIHRTMRALKPGASFVINIGSRKYPLNARLHLAAKDRYEVLKYTGLGWLSGVAGYGKDGEGETFYRVINPGTLNVDEIAVTTVTTLTTPLEAVIEPLETVLDAVSEPEPVSVPTGVNAFLGELESRPDDGPEPFAELEPEPAPRPAVSLRASLASFLGHVSDTDDTRWTASDPPELTGIDTIIVNFETNGLEWWNGHRPIGATIGTLDGQLKRFLPFGFSGRGNLDEAAIKRFFEREVRGKHIVNANTKFDVHMARAWGIDLEAQGNTVSDVQHYAALLDDYRRKFALDILAKDMLGGIDVPRMDETEMQYYEPHEVAARAEYQAQLVAQLHGVMWPQLDQQDLQRVRQLEDDIIYPVCEMERNAAPMDTELLDQWCAETQQQLFDLLNEVASAVGFRVNPDATADWERLFTHLNLPMTNRTEKGAASFTDKILKAIGNPLVQKLRRAGKIASLRSKFLVAYREVIGDDRLLRFSLHQLRSDDYGTVRGRFSASNKNIQQVMNHDTHIESFGSEDFFIRRLFIPGAGMLFFAADAAQIEYRIFASHSNSKKILDSYAADPTLSYHRLVWEMIKPFKPDIPYTKVKSLNFLKLYGGGRDKAAAFLEIPRSESDQFVNAYEAAFPEVGTVSKQAIKAAQTNKFVRSVLGRRARFPDPSYAYKALNAVIQPTAADIFKTKLVELHRERKQTGFVMRYPVHDEICGDVPDAESGRMVSEILNRQSFLDRLRVPILWTAKMGKNWAECK